jgi:hypothetical protein
MAESASVIPGVTQWNRLEDRVFAFSCGLRPQAFPDEKGRSDNCCEHPWSDWTRQYRNSQGIQVWLSVGGRINKGCKIMLHPCHKRLLFAYLYHLTIILLVLFSVLLLVVSNVLPTSVLVDALAEPS